jgi:hypothetical protein
MGVETEDFDFRSGTNAANLATTKSFPVLTQNQAFLRGSGGAHRLGSHPKAFGNLRALFRAAL